MMFEHVVIVLFQNHRKYSCQHSTHRRLTNRTCLKNQGGLSSLFTLTEIARPRISNSLSCIAINWSRTSTTRATISSVIGARRPLLASEGQAELIPRNILRELAPEVADHRSRSAPDDVLSRISDGYFYLGLPIRLLH
jgi:hypothetical protein